MRSYMVENGYPDFLEHLRYMIATATPGMLVNVVVVTLPRKSREEVKPFLK